MPNRKKKRKKEDEEFEVSWSVIDGVTKTDGSHSPFNWTVDPHLKDSCSV